MPYLLAEAARFRGYTQSAWESEDGRAKARVVAHYLEHSIRESHAHERAKKKADRKGKPPPTDFFRYRQGKKA